MEQDNPKLPSRLDRAALMPRVGGMEQLASIRRLAIEDGKGRGMRVWEVSNGSGLAFTVYPDRGLDIGRASIRGVPVAWYSANGEVAPAFYEPEGAGWLRSWAGGLLTSCGLANVGTPCDVGGEPQGLHGRLSHIPAAEVNSTAACWGRGSTSPASSPPMSFPRGRPAWRNAAWCAIWRPARRSGPWCGSRSSE